ncbi:hypothetical protein ACFCV8_07655 [Streptomyces sp. NPDC056347]|uniref:hypothetical protein n=1 Tax=Streptomyces sp. NPDC056347 TaxID=3345790 RepID=UPI0035D7BB12
MTYLDIDDPVRPPPGRADAQSPLRRAGVRADKLHIQTLSRPGASTAWANPTEWFMPEV